MDLAPVDNTPQKVQDPKYKNKLELSYVTCLEELCSPVPNWEEIVNDTKFIMDPKTGQPSTVYDFTIDKPDNIDVPDSDHSYVFKRSHFYSMFSKRSSRLKRDLIRCWKDRGYYIHLYQNQDTSKWVLSVAWRN
jgi:hypothetical protein